jgi:hypothetical protein
VIPCYTGFLGWLLRVSRLRLAWFYLVGTGRIYSAAIGSFRGHIRIQSPTEIFEVGTGRAFGTGSSWMSSAKHSHARAAYTEKLSATYSWVDIPDLRVFPMGFDAGEQWTRHTGEIRTQRCASQAKCNRSSIALTHESGTDLYGLQFRDAPGGMQGFASVFRHESAHHQRQLSVGCHVDWSRFNSLHVLGSAGTATVHFHDEFDCLHIFMSLRGETGRRMVNEQFIPLLRHYRVETVATPHSKQRAFSDVINPQAGHILCDRTPVICGISLRIHRSSRIVKTTISRPKEILVAFINRPFLASPASTKPVAQDRYGRNGQTLTR